MIPRKNADVQNHLARSIPRGYNWWVAMSSRNEWYLYILRCRDGSFYTGITTDVQRRVAMHNEGKAARYSRGRRPVTLIHVEKCRNKTDALQREHAIKELTRKEKENYVKNYE
jgi:putative endonuclease